MELYYGVSYGGASVSEERFNLALTQLLDALDGLIQDVQSKMAHNLPGGRDSHAKRVPYRIQNGEIGDHSIRYKSAESQHWTLAMKFFLTNL